MSHLHCLLSLALCSAVAGFEGYWTYSPSFEAKSGIKGIKKEAEGEGNLFLIPERNSFKFGNETIYQCKMCDFRTWKPKDYELHVREKHFYEGHEVDHQWLKDLAKRQDFNYTCNVCGEIYKTEMALLWHMTKTDHVIDNHDNELAKYLRARIQLNETINSKVIYHSLVRPFYKVECPSNESHEQSAMIESLARGYERATFVVPRDDLSSGDISNQFHHDSIIKTGFSKYQHSGISKRFKKVNGVNVYQRSPEVQEYGETDETMEAERVAAEKKRREERTAKRIAYAEQDTEELAKKEMKEEEESVHSGSYYRRQIEEYGPWASHSDKVGDQKLKKITRLVRVTKAPINQKDPIVHSFA